MFRRSFACLLLVLAGTASSYAAPHSGLAPADEYFGRMKMSILEIRNRLHDAAIRVGSDPAHADAQLGSFRWLEDAIEDWGNKYPQDTWLPGTMVALDRLYARLHSAGAHAQQARILAWVHRHYAGSSFERAVRVAVR